MFFGHDVGFQCARVSAEKNTMKFRKSTVTRPVCGLVIAIYPHYDYTIITYIDHSMITVNDKYMITVYVIHPVYRLVVTIYV